jgi:hypothetical protein
MKRNSLVINGRVLLVLGVILTIVTTKAYGNNFVAQTVPEALTDLAHVIVALTGYVMVTVGKSIKE